MSMNIFINMKALNKIRVGLVDADLLDNGSRHPNLVLLKIAGLLNENNIQFELITSNYANTKVFDYIYMSKVFTFTKEPAFYLNASEKEKLKFHIGGTGYYATELNTDIFNQKRQKDMTSLSNDTLLNKLRNSYGIEDKKYGIIMERQMPYYDLYLPYIISILEKCDTYEARKRCRQKYKDYLDYSIGFLTRGCTRHCPFCVNRLENHVVKCSELEWFYDRNRPYVYFWDDNFLASPREIWQPILQKLIDEKVTFQFRQGLDERQFAESPHGEEMAKLLSMARYHGDYIFAFDNWRDREVIERSLQIWKRYKSNHTTKFYLFCGFMQKKDKQEKFYKDIWELFQRIKILMQYECLGYVMRHEDYHQAPIANIYVQIARWCNQPAFFKKMSFWEYCYRNQSYWEQKTLNEKNHKEIISFQDFEQEIRDGRYKGKIKMCLPLKTIISMLDMFPSRRNELIEMFNYKYDILKNPDLWERK